MMKLIFTSFVLLAFAGSVLLACPSSVLADRNVPLFTVRGDFREASVVVRMNITDTKFTSSDTHYYYFTASGEITASFKGKFQPGEALEFTVRAEHGYDHTSMRGDQIAFLTSFVNRRDGPFQELPSGNSVIPYSQDLLLKVRTVRREWVRRMALHNNSRKAGLNSNGVR